MLKKYLKDLIVILIIAFIMYSVLFFYQKETACCLCTSTRHHAPCLVDLTNGTLIELDLYFPHPTKSAELAETQPEMDTFSFLRFGNVTGSKQTGTKRIALTIPASEKTVKPLLCGNCRKQLDGIFVDRYILADLYDKGDVTLIPIDKDLSMVLRCYQIVTTRGEHGVWDMIIQGTLES